MIVGYLYVCMQGIYLYFYFSPSNQETYGYRIIIKEIDLKLSALIMVIVNKY